MRVENSFDVPAPREQAWALLNDVPRVIPCMPGAELTETVDDSHWKAKLTVKLGPMSFAFAADVAREEADAAAGRARLATSARETKGRGSARATIESSLSQVDGGTRVDIVTDVNLVGPVAQYGRGMVQDVAGQLTKSFAECLEQQLAAEPEQAQAAVAAQAKPVSGLALGVRALGSALGRLVRRLTRRG
jgi:carbon monoxide dehydrogenase subunit G